MLDIKLDSTEEIFDPPRSKINKFIFLESGSGAQMHVDSNTIKALKEHLDVPLIVGGGICCCDDVKDIKVSNPDFIVIGNLLESNQDISFIKEMVDLIHE